MTNHCSPHIAGWQRLVKNGGLKAALHDVLDKWCVGGARLSVGDVTIDPPEWCEERIFSQGALTWKGFITAHLTVTVAESSATHRDTLQFELPWMTSRGTFLLGGYEYAPIVQILPRPGIVFRSNLVSAGLERRIQADVIPQEGAWLRLHLTFPAHNGGEISRGRIKLEFEDLGYPRVPEWEQAAKKFVEKEAKAAQWVGMLKPKGYEENVLVLWAPNAEVANLADTYKLKIETALTEATSGVLSKIVVTKRQAWPSRHVRKATSVLDKIDAGVDNWPEEIAGCVLGPEGRKMFDKTTESILPGAVDETLKRSGRGERLTTSDLERICDCLMALACCSKSLGGRGDTAPASLQGVRALDIAARVDDTLKSALRAAKNEMHQALLAGMPWSAVLKLPSVFARAAMSYQHATARVDGTRCFVRTAFGHRAVMQPLDETNPLATVSQLRKVTRRGPKGVAPEYAPPALRDLHPSQRQRLCPFETTESEKIGLDVHLSIGASLGANGCIVPAGTTRKPGEYKLGLGWATSLVPFLPHNDAVRAVMGAKNMKQALPLVNPEAPEVRTGNEQGLAEAAGCFVRSRGAGTVSEVREDAVVIMTNGRRGAEPVEYGFRPLRPTLMGTLAGFEPRVGKGDKVKIGDILAAHPATTDEGELALGKNLLVAYMPFRGLNFEDGIVASERLVTENVLTSRHLKRVRVRLGPGQILFPGQAEPNGHQRPDRLDEQGIVRVNVEVRPGDELVQIYELKKQWRRKPTIEAELLCREGSWCSYRRVPRLAGPDEVGRIRCVKLRQVGQSEPWIEIWLYCERPLRVGDKLMGRHGNKGVVTAILPKEEMPHIPKVGPVDLVLNPVGVLRRANLGQLVECHVAWARRCGSLNREKVFPAGQRIDKKELKQWLGQAEHVDCTGKVQVKLGQEGESTQFRVAVGYQYFFKLNHMAEQKVVFRGIGPTYAPITRQPAGGRKMRGGQRWGEMEVWALEAWNCPALYEEFHTTKADDLRARNELRNLSSAAATGQVVLSKPVLPESKRLLYVILAGLGLRGCAYRQQCDGTEGQHRHEPIGNALFDPSNPPLLRGLCCNRFAIDAITSEQEAREYPLAQLGSAPCGALGRQLQNAGMSSPLPLVSSGATFVEVRRVSLACGCSGPFMDVVDTSRMKSGEGSKGDGKWCCRKHPKAKYDMISESTDWAPVEGGLYAPEIWGESRDSVAWHGRFGLIDLGEEVTHPLTGAPVRYLPIVPPQLRFQPGITSYGQVGRRSLDDYYRRVIWAADKLGKEKEAKKDEAIADAREVLERALKHLVHDGLIRRIEGKEGFLRQRLLGKRVDLSGRAVIVGDPSLGMDQCGIPLDAAIELVGPPLEEQLGQALGRGNKPLARELISAALCEGEVQALKTWLEAKGINFDEFAERLNLDDKLSNRGPAWLVAKLCHDALQATNGGKRIVILNRAPSLHRYSAQAFYPTVYCDRVIALNPLVCGGFNADFDGDTMSVNLPLRQSTHREAIKRMLPSKNQRSVAGGQPLAHLVHEILAGRALKALQDDKGTQQIMSGRKSSVLNAFGSLLNTVREQAAQTITGATAVMDTGFKRATEAGLSVAFLDIPSFKNGGTLDDWLPETPAELEKNPLAILLVSGALGNAEKLMKRLSHKLGALDTLTGDKTAQVEGNLQEGLGPEEIIECCYNARKTLADKKLMTPIAGDLTRRMVWAARDIRITKKDCRTDQCINARALAKNGQSPVLSLDGWVRGRCDQQGELICKVGSRGDDEEPAIRSPLTCLERERGGVCQKCYGLDLATGKFPEVGAPVGLIAATSIGERGTQLAMRTFHAGAAEELAITGGLSRITRLLEGQKVPVAPAAWRAVAGCGKNAGDCRPKPWSLPNLIAIPDLASVTVAERATALARVLLYEMYQGYDPNEVNPRHFEVIASALFDGSTIRGLIAATMKRLEATPLRAMEYRDVRHWLQKIVEKSGATGIVA